MAKNKGYTLVEMLIVIAIMVILASLSVFSVGIIRDAKRSAAVNTFDNQLSSCLVKTKATSDVSGKQLCMYIYKRTIDSKSNYCIKIGYSLPSASDGVEDITKKDSSNNPIAVGILSTLTANNNDDTNWDAVLPKDVTDIVYNGTSITAGKVIKFNKSDGSVDATAAGTYTFYKNGTMDDGGEPYASIYLDKNTGNHYIK